MMSKSNLAFALEPEEALEAEALNAVSLAQLLRLSSASARSTHTLPRVVRSKRRRTPVCFKDNHSGDFRPFRVY